jgi:copper chaperone
VEQVTLKVTGMTCGGCVRSVKKVLESVPGVANAEVSLDQAEARVQFDPARADARRLAAAVESAGYQASIAG